MGEPLRVQVSHQALPPALVPCRFATRRFGQPGSVRIGLDLTAGPHVENMMFGPSQLIIHNDVRLMNNKWEA